MDNSILIETQKLIREKFSEVESLLDADVIAYHGEIVNGVEDRIKDIVEELKKDIGNKHEKLYILLTTPGGSVNPVKRMVTVFRHFYQEVYFIVPDYAYSAGTILCMSGDGIYMNYYSALGPIDPQVQNKDGKLVAALGYLDKVNEMIEKSRNGTLTQAEFLILKDFDLAELRAYEQAKELAIDLVQEWLVEYKFKDWTCHANGEAVTREDKKERAIEIAKMLSDNNRWKSHGRPITIKELRKMKLKIDDYGDNKTLADAITSYHNMMVQYIKMNNFGIFVQTRRFL